MALPPETDPPSVGEASDSLLADINLAELLERAALNGGRNRLWQWRAQISVRSSEKAGIALANSRAQITGHNAQG
jgi:hypothetical protein